MLQETLHIAPGLTAIIGAGGKSTLLRCLAEELALRGRVIVATSTKMQVPDWYQVILEGSADRIKASLEDSCLVCVGSIQKSTGKLDAPLLPFDQLVGLADYVLVEADGSRGLPLKAHAPHEPVIPPCAKRVICVVGADGIGKPVHEVCHRPEIFARLSGLELDETVTTADVAHVLQAEALHDDVLINKVHTVEQWQAAQTLAGLLGCPVYAGSLWDGELRCLR